MKSYKLYEFDEHRIYKYCKMIGKKSKLYSAADTQRLVELYECLAVYNVFSCMESFIIYASLFFENGPIKRHKPDHVSKTFVTQCISITTAERTRTHAFRQASSFLATISRNSEKQTSSVCHPHITKLSPMRSGLSCRQVYVGFVVDKVTAGQLFSSSTSILLCLCHSTSVAQSCSIHLSLTLYNLGKRHRP